MKRIKQGIFSLLVLSLIAISGACDFSPAEESTPSHSSLAASVSSQELPSTSLVETVSETSTSEESEYSNEDSQNAPLESVETTFSEEVEESSNEEFSKQESSIEDTSSEEESVSSSEEVDESSSSETSSNGAFELPEDKFD